MPVKEGFRHVIGKKLQGALVFNDLPNQNARKFRMMLVFDDNTYYELYGYGAVSTTAEPKAGNMRVALEAIKRDVERAGGTIEVVTATGIEPVENID